MNPTNQNKEANELTEIDRILVSEELLVPSSGFLASVMERVREEASAPPPIPFPWKRAVPGIVVATGVLGWGAVELARHGLEGSSGLSMTEPHVPVSMLGPLESAGWVVIALGCSLVSWIFSRRFTGRSDSL